VGIESSFLDVDVLLMHVLEIDRNTLLTNHDRAVKEDDAYKFARLIDGRSSNIPIQYLVGKCEFMSLEFIVDENVLIPRPDTEILVETVLTQEISFANGLEIGVGSGCISISLEHYAKNIKMRGVDISNRAVQVAAQNYGRIISGENIFFVSNLFENVPRGTLFDFIVSNPPYIEAAEIERLDNNVKDYEPRLALDGGPDGLQFYRDICAQAGNYLTAQGRIYFEIGYNQADAVKQILADNGFSNINVIKDLADKNRVIWARRT